MKKDCYDGPLPHPKAAPLGVGKPTGEGQSDLRGAVSSNIAQEPDKGRVWPHGKGKS